MKLIKSFALLILLLLLIQASSIAQVSDQQQMETAIEAAIKSFEVGDKVQADSIIKTNLATLNLKEVADTTLGFCYMILTKTYHSKRDYQGALTMQRKSTAFHEKGFGLNHIRTANELFNLAALLNIVANKVDSAIIIHQKALEVYKAIEAVQDIAEAERNLGLLSVKQKRFEEAESYYQASIKTLESIPSNYPKIFSKEPERYLIEVSRAYLNLAEIYVDWGLREKALLYFQKSNQVIEQHGKTYPKLERDIIENQAQIYFLLKEEEKSIALYKRLLEMDYTKSNLVFRARVFSKLAQVYSRGAADFTSAIEYWKKVLDLNSGEATAGDISVYREIGYCHLSNQDYPAAQIALDKALELEEQFPSAVQKAIIYFNLARLADAQRAYEKALEHIDLSIATFNFPPSTNRSRVEVLKSSILYHLYEEKDQIKYLEQSEEWARKSLNSLALAEKGKVKSASYGEDHRRPTELLLECLYSRYSLNSEASLLDEIFFLMEQNRSRKLQLGEVWSNLVLQQQYPDALIQEYQKVQKEISSIRDNNYTLQLDAEMEVDSILSLEKQSAQIQSEMNAYFPISLINITPLSIAAVQEQLPSPKDATLTFFSGDSTLFALLITKTSIRLHRLNADTQWQSRIKDASNFFRTPPQADNPAITTIAYSTFDLILAPLISDKLSVITNLYISTDGLLATLPFSALCTSSPKDNNYKSWPFLIKQFNISYLPYVSYLQQYKGQTLNFKRLACFAPVYNQLPDQLLAQQNLPRDLIRSEYYQLPGAQAEVKRINTLFPQSRLFAGEPFPKEMFVKHAPKYDLLHLAMHAVADYQNPIESKLVFSTYSGQASVLSMEELLDLDLKTQHLVLSACYTGTGNYLEGEGQISIAYAFQQLGIPTIISNSWAAPDQSASRINTGYYQALKQGEPAQAALKNAQIAYLEADGPILMGHPYYWAGIQLQGDTSTSFKTTSGWRWLVILGILGLGLVYFLFSRANKSVAPLT